MTKPGSLEACIPVVRCHDVVANFQTVVGERVDALDEMNQWPQRGRHAWWALLRLSSIPIKSNYIARDSTIDAELLVGVRKLENLFPIHEVTVFTGRRLMITRQGKPGLIVKAAVRIDLTLEAHYIPAVRGMTLFTGHTFELFVKSWWVGRKMAGFAGLRC